MRIKNLFRKLRKTKYSCIFLDVFKIWIKTGFAQELNFNQQCLKQVVLALKTEQLYM